MAVNTSVNRNQLKSTTFLFTASIMWELALLILSGMYSIDFSGLLTVMRRGRRLSVFWAKDKVHSAKVPLEQAPPSPLSVKLPLVHF